MNTYIVTLTWNCGNEFRRCAKTVAECTRVPARWVIVENGSIEQERLIVEQAGGALPRGQVEIVHYQRNEENMGLPAAQNGALSWIAHAESDPYQVLLLDADAAPVEHGWLEKMLSYAKEHPEIGILGGAKSPGGISKPVYHHRNGRWYVHDKQVGDGYQGESVDFACALLTQNVIQRGMCFDLKYHFYGGHDPDMCFRARSWGYTVVQIDAGVLHFGSAAMKKAGYQWRGGGKKEWDQMRARNTARFSKAWEPFLADHRDTIKAEIAHIEAMNRKLVKEAGDRKNVPLNGKEGD